MAVSSPFSATVNNVAVDILVQVFFEQLFQFPWAFTWEEHCCVLWRVTLFSMLRDSQTFWDICTLHKTTIITSSNLFRSLPTLVSSIHFYYTHFHFCKVESHCGFELKLWYWMPFHVFIAHSFIFFLLLKNLTDIIIVHIYVVQCDKSTHVYNDHWRNQDN
jgi:hypothetical protein